MKVTITASRDYLLEDSNASYYFRNQQITIHSENDSYHGILNQLGQELLELVVMSPCERLISPYRFANIPSGSWFTKPDSPRFLPTDYSMLNSWENVAIEGLLNGKYIKTSIVVLYTEAVCVTKSGTIYLLGDKAEQI
jgi:hypothetical protein